MIKYMTLEDTLKGVGLRARLPELQQAMLVVLQRRKVSSSMRSLAADVKL